MCGVHDIPLSHSLCSSQKRWCAPEGVDNRTIASEHRDLSFGTAYGVLIKELRLLGRAAFVVSSSREVTYTEYVREVGGQPDFEAIMQAARLAAGAPA